MKKKNVITEVDIQNANRLRVLWNLNKDKLSLSQEKAADMLGFKTQAAVSQYLNAKIPLNTDTTIKFAKLLGVAPEEINPSLSEILYYVRKSNYSQEEQDHSYPLLTKVQAGKFTAVDGCYTEKDAIRWVKSTKKASDKAFWLLVEGDSMTSPVGLSFPDGMLILVEPKSPVVAGDLIVAYLTEANEATFKKYIEDAGMKYLKPLNPNYPLIRIDGSCKVVGKVIDAKWEL